MQCCAPQGPGNAFHMSGSDLPRRPEAALAKAVRSFLVHRSVVAPGAQAVVARFAAAASEGTAPHKKRDYSTQHKQAVARHNTCHAAFVPVLLQVVPRAPLDPVVLRIVDLNEM